MEDVGAEAGDLLQEFRVQLVIVQCLQLAELLPVSGPIEDEAFLLWEEFPDTESGQIKIFIFRTGTWSKIQKDFA